MRNLNQAFLVLLLFALFAPLFAQEPITAGASFDLGFSPGGSSLAVVLEAIGSAKNTLQVACYEFTSREIAAALEEAAHRGVKVAVVADYKSAHEKYSQVAVIQSAGIPVRLDEQYAIFHHKFIIIDGASVETGSFNYSSSAIKHNAENALVLWSVPNIAARYYQEFKRLWDESR